MTRRSKDIGTATETAVVKYLVANGFPNAERRSLKGTYDMGDVTGTPGIVWEVKGGKAAENASDGQVEKWLVETETERDNAKARLGVLVVKRKGIGSANAGQWWAIVCVSDLVWDAGAVFPVRLYLADAVRCLAAELAAEAGMLGLGALGR